MTGGKPDERIRTPLRWDATDPAAGFSMATPWEPLSDDPADVNIETEAADPDSLLSTYRSFVRLRTDHPALGHGDWTAIDSTEPAVHAFLRQADGESVVVAVNLGEVPVAGLELDLEAGPLCGSPGAEVLFGSGEVRAPAITPSGGLDGYVPVDTLGAHETIVIGLTN